MRAAAGGRTGTTSLFPPRARAAFLLYSTIAVAAIVYLIYWAAPKHGTTNIFVYLGICSTAGSLSVISCKVCQVKQLQPVALAAARALHVSQPWRGVSC